MPRSASPFAVRTLAPLAFAAGLCAASGAVQAQLFGDDEARKAIIELRARVESDRRATEAQLQRITQDLTRLGEDSTPTRRGLLELSNQIEALRAEQARMRGQSEQLARDVAEVQRQQKDVLAALNDRLRQLEPSTVTLDGQEFRVKPDEKAEFDQAMDWVRKAGFEQAVPAFNGLLRRFPDSGYRPVALFWLGNSLYATSAFREAIASYQRLLTIAPDHLRVPEARLAIANCQMELKDTKSAKRTLEDLVKLHPQSEAAATAKDRLSRLR
jgi:tol-pal system protein YbgF